MSRWIIAAVLAVAATGLVAGGATAAKKDKPANFRHVLSAKLGQELDKPAGDVLAALKAARPAVKSAEKGKKRDVWTAAVAKSLNVEPAKVTAAVHALVKQRLDSLVEDGWLTQAQAAKREHKLGVGFLRIR
jgi:outer membrane murein-binding lipoprotein Lpp